MNEARALRLSVYASLVVGVVGIVWGLVADSRIVLFDGVFTIFGTALSGPVAARLLGSGPRCR